MRSPATWTFGVTLPRPSSMDIINNFFFKVQLDNRIVNPLGSSEVKLGNDFALEMSKSDKKSEIFGFSRYLLGDLARFAAPL